MAHSLSKMRAIKNHCWELKFGTESCISKVRTREGRVLGRFLSIKGNRLQIKGTCCSTLSVSADCLWRRASFCLITSTSTVSSSSSSSMAAPGCAASKFKTKPNVSSDDQCDSDVSTSPKGESARDMSWSTCFRSSLLRARSLGLVSRGGAPSDCSCCCNWSECPEFSCADFPTGWTLTAVVVVSAVFVVAAAGFDADLDLFLLRQPTLRFRGRFCSGFGGDNASSLSICSAIRTSCLR
mmetsp:Transcript_19890/g.39412  ORF Transcript_19890/g.39412 Transcript_19890/m.39412 type:complete len:239 (-) Transcript_19890:1197-1913(-)